MNSLLKLGVATIVIVVILLSVVFVVDTCTAQAAERLYPVTVFEVKALGDSVTNFWSYDGPSAFSGPHKPYRLHWGFGTGTLVVKEYHYLFTAKQVRNWKAVVVKYGGSWGAWFQKFEGAPLLMLSSGNLSIDNYMKFFHNRVSY
jgi:hypothetical protein